MLAAPGKVWMREVQPQEGKIGSWHILETRWKHNHKSRQDDKENVLQNDFLEKPTIQLIVVFVSILKCYTNQQSHSGKKEKQEEVCENRLRASR